MASSTVPKNDVCALDIAPAVRAKLHALAGSEADARALEALFAQAGPPAPVAPVNPAVDAGRRMLELSPDPMLLVSTDGAIVLENAAAHAMRVKVSASHSADSILEGLSPRDAEAVRRALGGLSAENDTARLQVRSTAVTGTVYVLELVFRAYFDAGESTALVWARDVSDENLAEAERDRLFAVSEDALVVVDDDDRVVRVSSSLARWNGCEPGALLSERFVELFADDARLDAVLALRRARTSKSGASVQVRAPLRDGKTVAWSLVRDEVSGLLYAVGRDVTEEDVSARELQRRERLYRALARSLPNGGVFLWNKEHRFLIADGQAIESIGLSRSTMEGACLRDVVPDEAQFQQLSALYDKVLAGESHTLEFPLSTRDGTIRVHYTPVRNDRGDVFAGMGLILDITEDQRQKRELSRMALMAKHAHNGVVIADADGRIEWVNPGFERLTGYAADEVIGERPGHILGGPTTRAENRAALNAFIASRTQGVVEICNTRKDGSIYWADVEITPVFGPDGAFECYVGVQTDVTERKVRDEALSRSRAELSAVLESVPQALVWTSPEGVVTGHNPAFARLSARALDADLSGMSVDATGLPLPLRSLYFTKLRTIQRTLEPVLAEIESFESEHGGQVWIQSHHVPIVREQTLLGVVSVFEDVTEQELRVRELRSAEHRQNALLSAMPDIIMRLDERGRYIDVKTPDERMLAQPTWKLLGEDFRKFVPPFLAKLADEAFVKLRRGEKMVSFDYELSTPSGMTEFEARIVQSAEAEYTMIIRDISERKRVSRLKNDFVSTVSHELRTPLTSIQGSLSLIAGGVLGELPEQASHMVHIAHKNAERLVRLVNDILDLSKIESGKMVFRIAPTPVHDLVEQAMASTEAFAMANDTTFKLERALQPLWVNADGDRLVQVLVNFMSNAAKFSPKGVPVSVDAFERAGKVRVEVRDRGPGIPTEFQARVFEKFAQHDAVTNRPSAGGTGLGLAICKRIIDRLGGEIGFQTVPGKGTTFYFELQASPRGQVHT